MNEETCIPGTPGTDPMGLRARSCNRNPNVLCLTGPDSRKCGAKEPVGGTVDRAAKACRGAHNTAALDLVRFPPLLLAQSLPRKRFLCPSLLAGLHVKAVLLDFLDDVFLLHFALKAAQCILKRFTLLNDDFSHDLVHPQSG